MTPGLVRRLMFAVLCLAHPCGVMEARAQTIGTFRWQLAPYCNVLTLTVVQMPSGYALTGFDNRCGAVVRSPVAGTATINPNGSIAFGITTSHADGFHTITSATITLPTLSGTWSDPHSTSGTFVFNPPGAPAGEPRRITLRGNYGVDFVAAANNQSAVSAVSLPQELPFAPSAPLANFIPGTGSSTVNCPGTAADPQAAPGHLCIYERASANVGSRCITSVANGWLCDSADPTGFAPLIRSAAAGRTFSIGRWAVTLP
jgi:hypothetical protein